ncbi:DUF971 domain-containing protein [Engelhardtia mirabilis]|uniref:Gamma-butyrobetaine dioxygenase n=1 Tax=Engelhardtia mirabilis TaxID=2528011 RepID=A0A518BRM0_9BACT|nr:Gamma-butyrobetaine dioxygenase [Planctomycetes bacterium Pla133]QDV03948.1 Gamma-butyrobetaine dioxygenase [Planctomycetes bacterium Pla86]
MTATDRHRPRVITKSDPTKLAIEWADGGSTTFTAVELRNLCPCAHCVDEHSGIRRHDAATTPADLTTRDVALVGHYALSIDFSDGHSTGIFPYRMLRAAGDA